MFRKYNPSLGRWLSRDPIEDALDLIGASDSRLLSVATMFRVLRDSPDVSVYAAFGNAPTVYFDPFGLTSCKSGRFTDSTTIKVWFGIGEGKLTKDFRHETKVCPKKCEDCTEGAEITNITTLRVTMEGKFKLPIPPPPLVNINFFYGASGGGQTVSKVNTCTGDTKSTGCMFITVRAGLEGCAGKRKLGGEICLRGEGEYTHRWCLDGTSETCVKARVMMRTCFFSRCWDAVFYEKEWDCW